MMCVHSTSSRYHYIPGYAGFVIKFLIVFYVSKVVEVLCNSNNSVSFTIKKSVFGFCKWLCFTSTGTCFDPLLRIRFIRLLHASCSTSGAGTACGILLSGKPDYFPFAAMPLSSFPLHSNRPNALSLSMRNVFSADATLDTFIFIVYSLHLDL